MAVWASSSSFQVLFRSKASQVPTFWVTCHYVLHLFTSSLNGSLINRGGDAFCFGCSVCASITRVYCVCLDCVITLSHCSLTAKGDTVLSHETLYFAIRMNLKSASVVGFQKIKMDKKNLIFSILQTTCGGTSNVFSQRSQQTDSQSLCMTDQ